jgi:CHAD domain-containing protein
MPYRLSLEEDVPSALRAVAREQLDDAVHQLRDRAGDDPVDAVHAARKDLKKVRSLLRLARPGLGDKQYRRLNDELGDIGRRMSGRRDADVLVQTIDGLAERYAGQVPERSFREIRDSVAAGQSVASTVDADPVAAALPALEAAAAAVEDWPLQRADVGTLRDGALRAYERGRRALVALNDGAPEDEDLHTLRKRAKDLWYQTRLLEEAWPRALSAQADEAHELADLLGDDHDLAVLSERLGEPDADTVGEDDVRDLIARRRADLHAQARVVARRLYAEKPAAYGRRLGRLLRDARQASQHSEPAG